MLAPNLRGVDLSWECRLRVPWPAPYGDDREAAAVSEVHETRERYLFNVRAEPRSGEFAARARLQGEVSQKCRGFGLFFRLAAPIWQG
jgi:hypothetical protein